VAHGGGHDGAPRDPRPQRRRWPARRQRRPARRSRPAGRQRGAATIAGADGARRARTGPIAAVPPTARRPPTQSAAPGRSSPGCSSSTNRLPLTSARWSRRRDALRLHALQLAAARHAARAVTLTGCRPAPWAPATPRLYGSSSPSATRREVGEPRWPCVGACNTAVAAFAPPEYPVRVVTPAGSAYA
jgi:hypothetical protein